MPKFRSKLVPRRIAGWVRLWNSLKSLSVSEIALEAERPFTLALIGPPDHTALLAARLALEIPVPRNSAQGPPNIRPYLSIHTEARQAPDGSIVLYADPLTEDEARLAQALAEIVVNRPDLRLSLARHIPAFRPAVAAQMINEASLVNAKIALVSALPGVIPFTDLLLPVTALGDTVLLTRNQAVLLLKIAAAYGLPIDLRARLAELLPIVGGAFGWRAIARELVGLVPGGIGVVIKGSIAYAGTYTVGKAAAIYYSTGQALPNSRLKQLYRDALKEAAGRVRHLLRREPVAAAAESQNLQREIDKPAEMRV